MCGIVGVVAHTPVNQLLYDSLLLLQHRGQDAAGIVTSEGPVFHMYKGPGLVQNVFRTRNMRDLVGAAGIGHCRYPTAGSAYADSESQPFYVNSPFGVTLGHNGNLTNSEELKRELFQLDFRHVNTNSDSEVLLNVLALELERAAQHHRLDPEAIFTAVAGVHKRCRGAYAVVAMIAGYGMLAFRDPFGIRPLIIGKNEQMGGTEYIVASESVAIEPLGFHVLRDVAPGEAIFVDITGKFHARQCADKPSLNPCIFEFVYLARPDSVIDGTSVYESRLNMGGALAEKIRRMPEARDIDVVIPIPDSSRPSALELANRLGIKYREGFVKNRYIGRTFIMPGQAMRTKSVRQKLNPVGIEFKDKVVLLVDDSIVRGTTSREIVMMAREAGCQESVFRVGQPAGALSQCLRHRHAQSARARRDRPHRGGDRPRDRRGPAHLSGPRSAQGGGARHQSEARQFRGVLLRRQVHHRRHHRRLPVASRRRARRGARPGRGGSARGRKAAGLMASRRRSVPLSGTNRKHFDLGGDALERHRPQRFHVDALAQAPARVAVDQDGALRELRVRLDAGGEVDGVADARVGRAIVRAGVAGHHFAGARCRCRCESAACPTTSRSLVEELDQLDHFQRRAHRALLVVGKRQRRAEDRHQPVAHHQRDDSAVAADRVEHQRVVVVEEVDRLLGRLRLGERREVANVGKHHGGAHAPCRRARIRIAADPARPPAWRSAAGVPFAGRAAVSFRGSLRCAP